jgi:hypothetical protein
MQMRPHSASGRNLPEYVDTLQQSGRYSFASGEAREACGLSLVAFKHAARRLVLQSRLASPRRGFFVCEASSLPASGPAWSRLPGSATCSRAFRCTPLPGSGNCFPTTGSRRLPHPRLKQSADTTSRTVSGGGLRDAYDRLQTTQPRSGNVEAGRSRHPPQHLSVLCAQRCVVRRPYPVLPRARPIASRCTA